MAMRELQSNESVSLYGTTIGKVTDESVRKLLKHAGEADWSRELKEYIENWYVEYDRCPICGRKKFHWYREVTSAISVGFCTHCKTDIVLNGSAIEDMRTGKSGVLVEHNKLYPLPEKERIVLSYTGGKR